MALEMISPRKITRIARATTKTMLSLVLMEKAITREKISVSGARKHMRMIIWKAFCKLVTSVVRRVISPAVLNLSILEKENFWIFVYMASRTLQAKPEEALAAYFPASTPNTRPKKASKSIYPP